MRNRYLFISIFLFILLLTSRTFSQSRVLQSRPPDLDFYNLKLVVFGSGFGSSDVNGLDSVTRYDFTIKSRDGIILDCLKYIPNNVPIPAGGFPTVVMCHGFGDNKETLAGFCKAQAQYGYYTMTYSMRGQGKSGGLSNLISTTEMNDLFDVIAFIKGDSVNGLNPHNILIMGGSQGGLIPFMAACNGLQVKTIISALAPPNFASSWIENGCIKMTFLWTITYNSDTARYTPLVTAMSNWVYGNTKPYWDSLAYYVPQNRDFMNQVANNQVPMIIEGSWQDKFFNPAGIIQAASLFTAPFRFYVGAVIGHGGDQSATENTWHMNFFNNWFFYWLFGVQNGELTAPKYDYASTTLPLIGNWYTFIHDTTRVWPPAGISSVKLYFCNSAYLDTITDNPKSSTTLQNKVSGGLTMQQAVDYEFKGSAFKKAFTKASLVFDTDPLSQDVQMTGVPKISLNYQSNGAPFCQYNFQLIELDTAGNELFVTRINYTDRNYVANTKRTAYFNGQAHSHIFKAGNQIRLKVTNLDTNPFDTTFLGSNPFVLPVLINESNIFYFNSSSYLELPLKGGILPTISTNKPSLNRVKAGTSALYKYSLVQNYPNPFNPATTIRYSIPVSNKVVLKVYNILGEEVKELVNSVQEAGIHSVQFDGNNLASGIYFYKLVSGNFIDVKRMILIK